MYLKIEDELSLNSKVCQIKKFYHFDHYKRIIPEKMYKIYNKNYRSEFELNNEKKNSIFYFTKKGRKVCFQIKPKTPTN